MVGDFGKITSTLKTKFISYTKLFKKTNKSNFTKNNYIFYIIINPMENDKYLT